MSEPPHVRRARHEAVAAELVQVAAEFARRYAPMSEADEKFHGWLVERAVAAELRAGDLRR